MRLFQDRRAASHELARHLTFLRSERPLVLGLANSGVPMAEIIGQGLEAARDVVLIERLRAPRNRAHIVGAVDEHGRISMIESTARWHHLTSRKMVEPAREVFRQLQRRRGRIRSILPELDLHGHTVILLSQGVATGAKMLGAISSVRDRGARKVVVAAPAGSGEAAWQLHDAADMVVIPHRPAKFTSVGGLYQDSTPVSDEMVLAIVERWARTRPRTDSDVQRLVMKVQNDLGQLLSCEIDLPPGTQRGSGPYATTIFAHGYESDGSSPRSVPISLRLAKRGIIGIRLNFTGHGRSEGDLADATPARMAGDLRRVLAAVAMLDEVDQDRIGLVGAGTAAKLVLELAAENPAILAVVARGPMDGCERELARDVGAPTMLICGEQDARCNRGPTAGPPLPSTHQFLDIPDAGRLFGDAISREMMIGASVDWLADHLVARPVSGRSGEAEPPAAR